MRFRTILLLSPRKYTYLLPDIWWAEIEFHQNIDNDDYYNYLFNYRSKCV